MLGYCVQDVMSVMTLIKILWPSVAQWLGQSPHISGVASLIPCFSSHLGETFNEPPSYM